ncbi:MAG: response regulator transcription factor [Anaerolineae bacterium]
MRILLADDQPKVRFALRVLLERQPGLQVVGEATDADDLLAQMETACPDLVLLAWELPGLTVDPSTSSGQAPSAGSGQGLLTALRRVCPNLFVIALSGRLEVRQAALDAGADAFVCKCDPPERLLAAIADCAAKVERQVSSIMNKEVERCISMHTKPKC